MEAGKSYHIYTHANGFENLFRSDENYRYFLQRYVYFITPVVDTYAYCLMPNHLHFLVCIKDAATLEEVWKKNPRHNQKICDSAQLQHLVISQFAHLFNGYTQAYNKMYNRMGSLFVRSFKRKEVTDDNYFTRVIIYIHNNPIHHGFTTNHAEWPWSSYHKMLDENPAILSRQKVLNWFGNHHEFTEAHSRQSSSFHSILEGLT